MQIRDPYFQGKRSETDMAKAFNVVLFGETGVGKSSIVNMLGGSPFLAKTSSGAEGCTFKADACDIDILCATFRIHDTAGLNEVDVGKVPAVDAILQLYKLLRSLKDGVSLLIFCMRGPRIKDASHKNWHLFYEIICQKKVPIVMAITGLENEEPMDAWWYANKGTFQKYDMIPNGVACITATRGKQGSNGAFKFNEEYEDSKQRLERLIRTHHLEEPWVVDSAEWFRDVISVSYESRFCGKVKEIKEVDTVNGSGIVGLIKRCEMPEAEAEALGQKLAAIDAEN